MKNKIMNNKNKSIIEEKKIGENYINQNKT